MNELKQTEWTQRMLGVLRIVAGFLFIAHGTQKLFNFPAGSGAVELLSLMGFAGLLEFVGGALIMVGLLTRTTGCILSGLMAAAYFIAHAPGGFLPIVNKGELAVIYSFLFLFFTFAGSGRFSLDGLIARRHFARQSVAGPTPEAA